MLQAYIDGSGTGDPNVLVLAGYVATSETWEDFSAAWQARLNEARLPYFKMNEMAPSRMEIAAYFYRLIEEHKILAAISNVMDTAGLRKVVTEELASIPDNDRNKLQNPYYLSFRAIIENLARYQQRFGWNEPVDFIFDEESEGPSVNEAWDLLKLATPQPLRGFMGNRPIFRSDKKFKPLQAADLYAWWVRKWEQDGILEEGVRDLKFAWPPKRKIDRLNVVYREPQLREGAKDILQKAAVLARIAPDAETARRILKEIEDNN